MRCLVLLCAVLACSSPRARVYVTGGSDVISVFALDLSTGRLTPTSTVRQPALPGGATMQASYLAFAPDGRHLFGFGNVPGKNGFLASYAVGAGGALTAVGAPVDTGARGAAHLAVHRSQRWIVSAHFSGNAVTVTAVGPDGSLGPVVDRLDTRLEAHMAWQSSDGRFVFVPCRKGNVILQLRLDPATGKLSPNDPPVIPAGGPAFGPRHMLIHDNQRWAYVVNELDGSVTSFMYDPASGRLSNPHTVSGVPDGFKETSAAHLAVHPNGRFLYASMRNHNSIALFAIDQGSGRLARLGNETGGGTVHNPRNFALDPTGAVLVVANFAAPGQLVPFKVDASNGKLTPVGQVISDLGTPSYVGIIRP